MTRELFARQLEQARAADGSLDLEALERLVGAAYDQAAEQRELTARQMAAALEHMAQGLSMFDAEQRLVICNPQYLELYNLPRSFGTPGTTFRQILEERIRTGTDIGNDPEAYVLKRLAVAERNESTTAVQRINNGRVIAVSHQPLAGGGWVSTHTDVTGVDDMRHELERLAYYDALTGLPNRNLILQRIAQAFAAPGSPGFALLFLDLDGFKTINDTLGHASGDMLLQQVAERLTACITPADTVGRLGGDEFAVILAPGAGPAHARDVAIAIADTLRRPYDIDGQAVNIASSVGIAIAPADGDTAGDLLKNGDLALYAAKADRRGSHRFFEPVMDRALQDRRRMEQDLARALENGEFELHYQPILNLKSQSFTGFEALLRWRHPVRGMIPPGRFIPYAEELGLIAPIGEWVIREAFSEAARWPSDLRIAVNVSSIQFERGNLVGIVVNALGASGLAPHRVEIEITESVFLDKSSSNLEILQQLHMLGCRIALDDFGTGYSALSYLLSFPFDKIKIDGSFVRALDNAEGAYTIVRAVSEIGNRMGMTTTAEGVETAEQLRNVHAVGYSEAQGFLISKPMTRLQLRRMLRDGDAMPEAPLLQHRAAG